MNMFINCLIDNNYDHYKYSPPLLPYRAYPSGDVVLLVLNAHTYDTTAILMSPSLAAAPRDVYWLSPPGNTTNVLSK